MKYGKKYDPFLGKILANAIPAGMIILFPVFFILELLSCF